MYWTQALTVGDDSPDPPKAVPTLAAAAGHWPQSVSEFEALVDALQHELLNFAFCRLHNLPDAEDVVQDVLVQAYAEREKHKAIINVRPYLYRMVSNRCVDLLRNRRRRGPSVDETDADQLPAGSPEAGVIDAVRRLRRIEGLLSQLPARQAEVLQLRIFAGLPFRAIAEAMGTSVPTIKSRFRYGVGRLRSILSKKEMV